MVTETQDEPVASPTAVWARPREKIVIQGITAKRFFAMIDEAQAVIAGHGPSLDEIAQMRQRIEDLEFSMGLEADDGVPRLKDFERLPGGRWKARIVCPDGSVHWFTSSKTRSMKDRRVSQRQRFRILSRDGYACRYCGRKPPDVELVLDHVHPVAAGGTVDDDNLVAACTDCNAGKSASEGVTPPHPGSDREGDME